MLVSGADAEAGMQDTAPPPAGEVTPAESAPAPWGSILTDPKPQALSEIGLLGGGTPEYWMSGIPGNVNVRDLSIPGTHQSASYRGTNYFDRVRCQSQNLRWQLENGVRYMDIRLRQFGGSRGYFDVYHRYWLEQRFGNVLQICRTFLNSHRSEAILMRVSGDGSWSDDYFSTFRHYLDTYWGSYGMRDDFYISSSFPTLGQARGKIVLMSGWPYLGYGLPFSNESYFDIQDNDESTPVFKRQQINGQLVRARGNWPPKSKMYVNHTSAWSLTKTPWSFASEMNPYTLDRLNDLYTPGTGVGVVAMDWINRPSGNSNTVNDVLPKAIIRYNPITSATTGPRVLTLNGPANAPASGDVYSGHAGQSFTLVPAGIGSNLRIYYRIVNPYNGLALSMGADSVVNAQPVNPWNDQYFYRVLRTQDEEYTIKYYSLEGVYNGLALTMSNTGVVTGTRYNNYQSQNFLLPTQGDGSTGIRSKNYWVGADSSREASNAVATQETQGIPDNAPLQD